MRYEWGAKKAVANLRLHGVDFVDAIQALEDPNRIEDADHRFDYGEERDLIIGMARNGVFLFVVVTNRGDDARRIISARRATKHEEDRYHEGDHEVW